MSLYKGLLKKVEQKVRLRVFARFLALLLVIPIFVKNFLTSYKLRKHNVLQAKADIVTKLNTLCVKPPAQVDKPLAPLDPSIDISIIIPVYNVEKFLKASIVSVMSQETNANYEVICINDGATDSSAVILSELASSHNNLVVVSQVNSGLSAARNTGIEIAKGRYFMFLDSDDIMLPRTLETAFNLIKLTKAEIVIGAYRTFINDNEIATFDVAVETTADYKFSEISELKDGYAWGKLYARELFSVIRYPKGYQFEDTITKPLLYKLAKSVVITSIPFVAYRLHSNSLTVIKNKDKYAAIHMLWLVELVSDYYDILQLPKDNYFNDFVIEHLTRVFVMRAVHMPPETVSKVFDYLRHKVIELNITALDNCYQARAWQAIANGNIKLWFFYSKLAVLGHHS